MKKQYILFTQSIKDFNKTAIYTLLIDFLSYVVIALLTVALFLNLQNTLNNLPDIPILDPTVTSVEELKATYSNIKDSIGFIITSFILSISLIFISWNLSKAYIYSLLLKKKLNREIFGKYLLMKILWFIIWLIPTLILARLLKPIIFYYLLALIIIFYFHFTFILNLEFFNDYKINNIKKVLKKNFRYCPRFIIPETIVFTSFILISQLYWLYRFLSFELIISGLIFLIFIGWTRIYLLKVFHDGK